jgi:serine/threonine protein kinase
VEPFINEQHAVENVDCSRLRAGVLVSGRYEIISHLGCGGMGTVYKARHVEIDRVVAVKFLHPRYASSLAAVKRFQREARLISALSHKNILTVYGFGEFEGVVYLAMEFVHGQSLGQIIKDNGPMQVNQALPLLLQICDAMSHAHSSEILHRDLKPDNVIVSVESDTRSVRVLDFGLAKFLGGMDTQRLTRTGEVVGDPRYMSPEQCQGQELDGRSDMYSFGCLMYELFTGKVPFDDDDVTAVMHKHLSTDPKSFSICLGLPAAIEAITFTAMAKDRRDRYESFGSVKEALKKFSDTPELAIEPPRRRRSQRTLLSARGITLCLLVLLLGLAGLARLAVSDGEWSAFSARVQYAFATNPTDRIKYCLSIADQYKRNSDYDSARSYYAEAAQLATRNAKLLLAARSYAALGDTYAAQNLQQQAGDSYAKSLSSVLQLVRKGEQGDELQDISISALRGLAKCEPLQAVQMADELSSAYDSQNMRGRARDVWKVVLAVTSNEVKPNILVSLGKLSFQDGRKDEATANFDRALNMTSDRHRRWSLMQIISSYLMTHGENALALVYLNRLLNETSGTAYPVMSELKSHIAECQSRIDRSTPAGHSSSKSKSAQTRSVELGAGSQR